MADILAATGLTVSDAFRVLLVRTVAEDVILAASYCDHSPTGDWQDHRDCHIKPDLILIYRKPDPDTLQLVRLGSHTELSP